MWRDRGTDKQTDDGAGGRQTDKTKLVIAFRNFVNALTK